MRSPKRTTNKTRGDVSDELIGGERAPYRGPSVVTRQELTAIQTGIARMDTKLDQLIADRQETTKRIDSLDDRVKNLEIRAAEGKGGANVWERILNIVLSVGIAILGTMKLTGGN